MILQANSSISHPKPTKNQELLSTTCSTDLEEPQTPSPSPSPAPLHGRKRVGSYSFRLQDLIGTGYTSRVYKGVRDGHPGESFAIKTIRLRGMGMANTYLLSSEVNIMQGLDHPHIVKLIDVLYTRNHCYLITEYCEGGTLERYTQGKESVEWGSIVHQISQGCQYLAGLNIVHRDLKPANIFLKEGKWKIGDFGFAKQLPSAEALIVEGFRVGSPLFMPLQTLERNMYSAKSDSFALGVIIYFLILKEFPWEGSSLNKLVRRYKERKIDWSRFQLLPKEITTILQGLLSIDIKERGLITSCDFSIFKGQKSLCEVEGGLLYMRGRVREQVVLCQFINYLISNSMLFLGDGNRLYSLMSDHLHHLTQLFEWDRNKCLADIKKDYILPQGKVKVTTDHYRRILLELKEVIGPLSNPQPSSQQAVLQKLLEYYYICRLTLRGEGEELSAFLQGIVLHKDFKDLLPNGSRMAALGGFLQENQ